MRYNRHLSLLLLFFCLQANAQTFDECSDNYYTRFKQLQLQRTLKQVGDKTADSVMFALGVDLDSCIIGKQMPEFELVGVSGKKYTNESLKGKVVLFNFWSVNCGPCVVEIPVFNRLFLSYRDMKDFVLISILWDKEEAMNKFLTTGLTKRRIAYEVIPDSKSLMKGTFKSVKALPTNLFMDREGKIFMKTVGGIIETKDEQRLEDNLRSIIDGELSKSVAAN